MVRDFVYNAEELQAGKDEMTKLATDKRRQFGPLVRWLKVNFSECFMAWIHVKVIWFEFLKFFSLFGYTVKKVMEL